MPLPQFVLATLAFGLNIQVYEELQTPEPNEALIHMWLLIVAADGFGAFSSLSATLFMIQKICKERKRQSSAEATSAVYICIGPMACVGAVSGWIATAASSLSPLSCSMTPSTHPHC